MSQILIEICMNKREALHQPSCLKNGSRKIYRELKSNLPECTKLKISTCMGYCNLGPVAKMTFREKEELITAATVEKIKEHLASN